MFNIIFSMLYFNIFFGYFVFIIYVLVEIVDFILWMCFYVVIGKECMFLMDFLVNENN